MSWSAPNFLDLSTQPGLTPGVSIKFLRSGTSSANFVTTNSMESLPDKNNFFSTPLSNHIPAENSTTTQSQRFCSTGKVIHTKYSKHRPSTVAHTFECVCSKINHGLNHGLFISLLKLINCPIH